MRGQGSGGLLLSCSLCRSRLSLVSLLLLVAPLLLLLL